MNFTKANQLVSAFTLRIVLDTESSELHYLDLLSQVSPSVFREFKDAWVASAVKNEEVLACRIYMRESHITKLLSGAPKIKVHRDDKRIEADTVSVKYQELTLTNIMKEIFKYYAFPAWCKRTSRKFLDLLEYGVLESTPEYSRNDRDVSHEKEYTGSIYFGEISERP